MKKSLLPFKLFLYSLRRSKFFFIYCQIFLIVIYCCRFCRIQYNNCCIAVENVFNSKFGYSMRERPLKRKIGLEAVDSSYSKKY